jgi:hypothetical protein
MNNTNIYEYNCANCGLYELTGDDNNMLKRDYADKKHLIAGYLYEFNKDNENIFNVTDKNLKLILNDGRMPQTPIQRLERLLLNLYKKSNGEIGVWYWLNSSENNLYVVKNDSWKCYPISMSYARNVSELSDMIGHLVNLEYLIREKGSRAITGKTTLGGGLSMTPKGLEKAEQLLNSNIDSTSAFVAMWFTNEMDFVYDNIIKSAIEECGFKAFRVDRKEHNNDITDEIIAGIKQSLFMIADLTGHRGGVYHEAGYARGLKREVILTCRKDWFDGDPKEYKKVHFDLNHFLIIVWEEDKLDDFKKAIINRIKATIL